MGATEGYFLTIAIIVALIGLARGYARELGSAMIILVAISLLGIADSGLDGALRRVGQQIFSIAAEDEQRLNLFVSLTMAIAFVATVFASYSGKTVDFQGSPAPPPLGILLSLTVGLVNGYLVSGTLWYYQYKYDYPLQALNIIRLNFDEASPYLINLLPQNLVPSPLYWMLPVALLLLLRVRG
jgi:hypothetical protein